MSQCKMLHGIHVARGCKLVMDGDVSLRAVSDDAKGRGVTSDQNYLFNRSLQH